METNDHVEAPFTKEQVDNINTFQQNGIIHQLTCVTHSNHALNAKRDGLHCMLCDRIQTKVLVVIADGTLNEQAKKLKNYFL